MQEKDQVKYRAYRFSIRIIKFISQLPHGEVFLIIKSQLIRAATSIGANIIEAQAASSKKDFVKFYHIALKSANETKYWLCILRDATEVEKDRVSVLLEEVNEIANILGASILTMKGRKR